MEGIEICGVRVDLIGREAAVRKALEDVGESCVVFTPNALMLERCRRDAALPPLFSHASLSLPDGVGVLWAARRRGKHIPMRVAGIEFGEALVREAARLGLRVFFLGGKEGIAARAAENMKRKYPSLCVAGTHWGYFDMQGEENRRVLEQIRMGRTDILFVCFGFPLQERWITENRGALTAVRVIAALGGSLDVWSGTLSRAPRLLRGLGLEWAWRMAREPRRLKDCGALLRFFISPPKQ